MIKILSRFFDSIINSNQVQVANTLLQRFRLSRIWLSSSLEDHPDAIGFDLINYLPLIINFESDGLLKQELNLSEEYIAEIIEKAIPRLLSDSDGHRAYLNAYHAAMQRLANAAYEVFASYAGARYDFIKGALPVINMKLIIEDAKRQKLLMQDLNIGKQTNSADGIIKVNHLIYTKQTFTELRQSLLNAEPTAQKILRALLETDLFLCANAKSIFEKEMLFCIMKALFNFNHFQTSIDNRSSTVITSGENYKILHTSCPHRIIECSDCHRRLPIGRTAKTLYTDKDATLKSLLCEECFHKRITCPE